MGTLNSPKLRCCRCTWRVLVAASPAASAAGDSRLWGWPARPGCRRAGRCRPRRGGRRSGGADVGKLAVAEQRPGVAQVTAAAAHEQLQPRVRRRVARRRRRVAARQRVAKAVEGRRRRHQAADEGTQRLGGQHQQRLVVVRRRRAETAPPAAGQLGIAGQQAAQVRRVAGQLARSRSGRRPATTGCRQRRPSPTSAGARRSTATARCGPARRALRARAGRRQRPATAGGSWHRPDARRAPAGVEEQALAQRHRCRGRPAQALPGSAPAQAARARGPARGCARRRVKAQAAPAVAASARHASRRRPAPRAPSLGSRPRASAGPAGRRP
jgi:hypothetical protein